jgi:hypothetical protein
MCDYNVGFNVPKYAGGGSGEDLTPFLDPLPAPCGLTIHPVTACNLRCKEIAKAKHEECKMKMKQFKEYMKTQGCPGTWCTTKTKRHCARRVVKGEVSKRKQKSTGSLRIHLVPTKKTKQKSTGGLRIHLVSTKNTKKASKK